MRIKETPGVKIFAVFNAVLMCCLIVVTFYPLYYIAMASLSSPTAYMAHTGLLFWPLKWNVSSYLAVFRNPMIGTGYLNTFIVVAGGTLLSLVLTSMGAYFLSRKNIMLRNAIMFFIVFTMFFNGGLVPFYLTVKSFHLDETLWALVLPTAISTFNLIIMRTAFESVPVSLEESAKLDGAGHFTILFRIILPLSMPTIAVMILFYGVGYWNAWFNAMIFLLDRNLWPLQLVLREILINNDTGGMQAGSGADQEAIADTIKYAVIMVATVPVLALYPFLQRYFVKGVMIGAIKE